MKTLETVLKIIIAILVLALVILFITDKTQTQNIGNPKSKFIKIGEMHTSRAWHKAILLDDGRVLILDWGELFHGITNDEIYDPQTKTFQLLDKTCPNYKDIVAVKHSDKKKVPAELYIFDNSK